ncbi:hypothetical protein [Succiniclasticum ruminis]|uniref:hypothetical protein n=1 Tax=Succiniclasticum ruminis TaxID=40841 RepID=UPI00115F85DA|nr:hypothetical protein [Succiniclasticum ruminis]
MAAQDPQFALGEIIGSALAGAYANNYNNRGINKAVDKALAEYGTDQQGNNVAGASMSDMDALNSVRQNMGLDNPQEQPVISVGTVPKQSPKELAELMAAPQAQPETPEQSIERLAQMPGAGIIAQENAGRRLGEFNKKDAMLRAEQQMIKDGRTPYQVEQAMRMLEPHFDRMQDDYYRTQSDRIMAELGQGELSDADYKQRIVELARLGDYGRDAANIYGKDIVTGRERWNAEQQAAREDNRFKQQAALREVDAANRLAIARERARLYSNSRSNGNTRAGLLGGGTRQTNGASAKTRSPLDSAEFKYIDTQINKIADIPEEERTPEQKRFFDQYKTVRDQIVARSFGNQFDYHTPDERGNNNANPQVGFNPNNYDQAVPYFRGFAKRGNFRKEDIAKYIRQKYYGLKPDDTSNEFVESIIREL